MAVSMKSVTAPALQTALAGLDNETETLRAARAGLALNALSGQQEAQSRMADIDLRLREIADQRITMRDALAALDVKAAEREREKKRKERLSRADQIDAAIAIRATANQALDAALAGLASALRDWLASDAALAGVGVADRGMQPYQKIAAAIWHWLDTAAGDQREWLNNYSRTLTEVFPRHSLHSGHWHKIADDHGIERAKTLVMELRGD